jgi:tetratricopeptide (TPR) repeat protein
MEENHLSLEILAKWLAGRLEHDVVLQRIVPHLITTCPGCRERFEQIRQLQKEAGHEDEEVSVIEWREAPELLRILEELPVSERHLRVEEDDSLHTWGLCQLLLQRSREAISEDPSLALSRAELAVAVSHHLGDAYDPGWVLDLRARAHAYRGNALRVLSELQGAEAAFREAELCLSRSGTGGSWAKAEILDLKSSLRQDQRRFVESEELLDSAVDLYREAEDLHGIGKIHLQRAKLYREMGDLERSIDLLRHSRDVLDSEQEPHLFAYARYNLLCALTLAGHHEEAYSLLPEVHDLFHDVKPLDRVRLRWAEGDIALGLGQWEEAEAAYREVQEGFETHRMYYNAALVALDLALLLARQGRAEELKRLAADLVAAFESRAIHREATAALILFQRSCDEERVSVEMISQLASLLRKRGDGAASAGSLSEAR